MVGLSLFEEQELSRSTDLKNVEELISERRNDIFEFFLLFHLFFIES